VNAPLNPGSLDSNGIAALEAKRIVAEGYDRIAERYRSWSGDTLAGKRKWAVDLLVTRLPPGSRVLDLGCATGVPVAKALAQHGEVTGIDLSPRQIEMARANVPAAEFVCGDAVAAEFQFGAFDAIVSCYAIGHVPRHEHPLIFGNIFDWLRPGGIFVGSLTAGDDPGTVEPDWLGSPMYFGGHGTEESLRLLMEAGLVVESAELVTEDEDGVPVIFLWVQASKPS
jgi:SAM-dependent methyltransferase